MRKSLFGLFIIVLLMPVTARSFPFDNVTSCQLSLNSDNIVGNCTDIPPPIVSTPSLYDGTDGTKYEGSFGAKYFRVTLPTGVTDGAVAQIYPIYAKVPAWNSDSTKLMLYSNNGFLHILNGTTYAYIEELTTGNGLQYSGQDLEPRWSHSDNKLFYYVSAMKFNSYNILNHTTTTLRAFNDSDIDCTGCASIHNGDEGNPDDTDRYWAFYAQTGSPNYAQQVIFVYDRQTNNVISRKGYRAGGICGEGTCPTTANWVGISHSGNYVVVNWNIDSSDGIFTERGKGTEVFDRNLNYIGKISEKNWHMDVAQLSDGTDVMVGPAHLNQAYGYKAIRITRLSDNSVVRTCYTPDLLEGFHVSGRTDGNVLKGWVLYSTYNQTGTGIGTGIFTAENFALNIDDCSVRRIAHTQSNWSSSKYSSEPHSVMNYNFTKIIWGSNWRNQSANVQTYVVDIESKAPKPPIIKVE